MSKTPIQGNVQAKNGKGTTSYDVARLAGVSQSAVSRCFADGSSISPHMRAKVMQAAKKLNYRPNAIARSLITRRTNVIAVFVSPAINFYYPEVLFQLSEKLAAQNLRTLLFAIKDDADAQDALDQAWQYQVDGLLSVSFLSKPQYKWLAERNIPIIMFNRYFDAMPTHSIWCDTSGAIGELVGHLKTQGHKHIGLLEGPAESLVSQNRMQAVQTALDEHGLVPVARAIGNFLHDSAGQGVADMMQAAQKPTAIICANDMMAMGVIDALKSEHGLNVPDDISVAGVDGIQAGQFAGYSLTTVRQPIDQMAEAAISLLVEHIEHAALPAETKLFSGRLIIGQSTAQPPKSHSLKQKAEAAL